MVGPRPSHSPRLSRSAPRSLRSSSISARRSASSARRPGKVSMASVPTGPPSSERSSSSAIVASRIVCFGPMALGPIGIPDREPHDRRRPPFLLLARPSPDAHGQGLFARAQERELVLDVVEPLELRHAVRPEPKLSDGLGSAKQERGEERTLATVEGQGFVDHVAIANGGPAMGGKDETDETLLLQLGEDRQHRALVIVGHGLPIGCLVAGGNEGVEGERVLLGSGELLLHERADHACRFWAQLHRAELTAGERRVGR